MFTIILQALSWLMFAIATIILGGWLRRNPTKRNAERTSRILHFLFWAGVIPPTVFGFFYPGLAQFDRALGLRSLPGHLLIQIIGALGLIAGTYLIIIANVALRRFGEGANAFFLTKRLVACDIYERMRNPMSVGLYLCSLGIGPLAGSTYMILGAVLIVIPVHVFYLKYFEELELELRLGESYGEYKRRVPFLLPKLISRGS
jgi:protein-S-isoprenylcysteine O-methyltransferase Ste14